MNTKRCLVVKTLDLALNDLIWGVMENNHECECYEAKCNTLDYDEKEIKNLSAFLKQTTFDLVLSMNFAHQFLQPAIRLAFHMHPGSMMHHSNLCITRKHIRTLTISFSLISTSLKHQKKEAYLILIIFLWQLTSPEWVN